MLTREGKKPIDQLRNGDWVISWDEETGEISERPVTEWYRREAPAIIDIFIGIEKISCTTDHPFWVQGKGWILAHQLNEGMTLRTRESQSLVIDEVRRRDEVTPVYNIEIDGLHTYFVSSLEILSHNICGGTQGPQIPDDAAIKVTPTDEGLTPQGNPMTPQQARRAVDRGQDVFTPTRNVAEEIAGSGGVGPEIHASDNGVRFPHMHRRSKSNPRYFGGHGRTGGHIFFGPGQ